MMQLTPGLSGHDLSREVGQWIDDHLPPDWRDAAERGDWEAVEEIRTQRDVLSGWFAVLGDSGLACPTWPTGYGGLGLDAAVAARVNEELMRRRAGRPDSDFVGLRLAGPTILVWGTEAQKERFLPPLRRGEHRWCQLFSEPGAGSDLASLSTRAKRRGNEWVVNGQKVWSSFAHESDFGLLMARSDPSVPKHAGLTYFLLDMRSPGVEVRPLRQMTGDAEFNEVFLSDVAVPDDARLGGVNEGWKVAVTTLMQERSGLSGRPSVGEGEADRLVRRAVETGRWEDHVVRDRLLRALVAERALQMTTVRAYVESVKTGAGAEGSLRKLAHATLAEELGVLATEVEPSNAIAWLPHDDEVRLAAYAFLGSKKLSIAGGTSEIQRNIIAERVLGLPRDLGPGSQRAPQ